MVKSVHKRKLKFLVFAANYLFSYLINILLINVTLNKLLSVKTNLQNYTRKKCVANKLEFNRYGASNVNIKVFTLIKTKKK